MDKEQKFISAAEAWRSTCRGRHTVLLAASLVVCSKAQTVPGQFLASASTVPVTELHKDSYWQKLHPRKLGSQHNKLWHRSVWESFCVCQTSTFLIMAFLRGLQLLEFTQFRVVSSLLDQDQVSGTTTSTVLRKLEPNTEYTVTIVPVYHEMEGKPQSENGKTSEFRCICGLICSIKDVTWTSRGEQRRARTHFTQCVFLMNVEKE